MKKYVVIFLIFFFFFPNLVFAHPGRTDKSGCHYCRTNCAKWGLEQNEYHCHNGNTYQNARGQTFLEDGTLIDQGSSSVPQEPVFEESLKSSDNTIRSLVIDDDILPIEDKMSYQTKKENVTIDVQLNSDKATYNIHSTPLLVGMNTITITVTAENGDTKDYLIEVERLALSSNTNLKLLIHEEEVSFVSYEAHLSVSSHVKSLPYEAILEDQNATLSLKPEKLSFQEGTNEFLFQVTAEDGTVSRYTLIVFKEPKNNSSSKEETPTVENTVSTENDFSKEKFPFYDLLAFVVGLLVFAGAFFLIYLFFKK